MVDVNPNSENARLASGGKFNVDYVDVIHQGVANGGHQLTQSGEVASDVLRGRIVSEHRSPLQRKIFPSHCHTHFGPGCQCMGIMGAADTLYTWALTQPAKSTLDCGFLPCNHSAKNALYWLQTGRQG